MSRWSRSLDAEVDAAKLDAGWERVRARRSRPRVLRKAMVVAPVLLVAALVLLAVRAWLAPAAPVATLAPPQEKAFQLAAIHLEGGGTLPAEWKTTPPTVVHLDDGSRLEIAPKTHLRTRPSTPERVELAIDDGKTTFDVKPGGPRRWIIDAGDVRVEVLGTRFTVARVGSDVSVAVERGKVSVKDASGERILTAGQTFATNPPNEPARVPVPDAPVDDRAKTATTATTPATAPAKATTAAAPSVVAAATTPTAPASTTEEDPMARADALRKGGRAAEAVTTLRELVDRGDRRASLAAFTLGKVHAEDLRDPLLAARWFERAIAIGLPGGLDEEAAARAVECFTKGGSRAEAQRAAERYEARFPAGRRIAQVREWAGAATP